MRALESAFKVATAAPVPWRPAAMGRVSQVLVTHRRLRFQ